MHFHNGTDIEPDKFYKILKESRFGSHNFVRTNIGIVVGSHLGIGGIGVTFFED